MYFFRASSREPSTVISSLSMKQAIDDCRFQINLLQEDVERLMMISEAMWDFMKKEHGYSDEELMKRVCDIDLRDGKLDEKVEKEPPKDCPSCQRTISTRHSRCMYCGQKLMDTDLFDR